MTARTRGRIADAIVGVFIVIGILSVVTNRAPKPIQSEFAQSVDLLRLSNIAVQHNGRLKSFDSFSRSMMKFVSGPRSVNGQSSTFTYFDLMFRPQAYREADIIYVKHKDMRRRIVQTLASDPSVSRDDLARCQEVGLFSLVSLARPEVDALLDDMSRDLIRTAKFVDMVRDAQVVSRPEMLSANLRIVPPAGDDAQRVWFSIDELWRSTGAPGDSIHAGMTARAQLPGLDQKLQDGIASGWMRLGSAWRQQDAAAVNGILRELTDNLVRLNPQLYPPTQKLELESWYVRYKGMVWTWMIYLLAVVPLLMSLIYHWTWARRLGLLFFLAALGLHTTSIGIRWYLADRIPNSNMFEATMAATWFGAVAALIMEFIVRKTAMRNLFVLGAGVCAMVAMMCSHFMPVTLSSDLNHVMPVLNDVWLYIHTNVIIFSYCLIAMAAVTALIYLRYRLGGGGSEHAQAGGAGQLILGDAPASSFIKSRSGGFGQVLDGATMVLMELSFVLLWAGLCMGAIWADHSWGRPWGWDPKEVFALNTFLVFLMLVHVRLKVRDKGLWTAMLACVGCGVMLFNWIVVNFIITGLHSYA